jgi:hypothetical protein
VSAHLIDGRVTILPSSFVRAKGTTAMVQGARAGLRDGARERNGTKSGSHLLHPRRPKRHLLQPCFFVIRGKK